MSDTPRTDAVEGYDDEYSNPELIALCRQLERELAEYKQMLEEALDTIKRCRER